MKVGIIGAGRIGKVHAKNISMFLPQIEIKIVADPFINEETAEFLTKECRVGNITKNVEDIFNDNEIEAVLICSATSTHAEYIIASAKAKKHIYCEKPIDYDLEKVHKAIQTAKDANVKLQIGFNRRFDHNYRAVYDAINDGKIGDVHMIKISSRDHIPPSKEYAASSGGIFYDMMIHDFDMARFLSGSEVEEVTAYGSVLVDPMFGEIGDVDTAIVMIKLESGAIVTIDCSRKAVYGCDQRVEVFGSKGMIQTDNDYHNTVLISDANCTSHQNGHTNMWNRYTNAFVSEILSFIEIIQNDEEPFVGGNDGLQPVYIAEAATKSLKEGRCVKISEIK